jgi:D-sedoheptulose 7-phosphate isomerase
MTAIHDSVDDSPRAHMQHLSEALDRFEDSASTAEELGRALFRILQSGGRVLAAGNGGSAAQAQHFTAELVGRYRQDRPAFSAICLNAETSTLTALGNDYGADDIFARQVEAHGHAGDVFVAFSTSGRSPNIVKAAVRARTCGLKVWAFCGQRSSPLMELADRHVAAPSAHTGVVQELHLVATHIMCAAFDQAWSELPPIGRLDRKELRWVSH